MKVDGILHHHHPICDILQLDGATKAIEIRLKAVDSEHESAQRCCVHGVGADVRSNVDETEMWMTDEELEYALDLRFFPNRLLFDKSSADISISFGVIQTYHCGQILKKWFGFNTTKGDVLCLAQVNQKNVRREIVAARYDIASVWHCEERYPW